MRHHARSSSLLLAVTWVTACTGPVVAVDPGVSASSEDAPIHLELLGTWSEQRRYAQGSNELVAFDVGSARLFVTDAGGDALHIVDLSDPASPFALDTLDLTAWGERPDSVAAGGGLVAVGVEAVDRQDPGTVLLLDPDGTVLSELVVGPLPDALAFTADGQTLIVANEGQPSDGYRRDPPGTIQLIDLSGGAAGLGPSAIRTATFDAFEGALPDGVRVFGPGASVAEDLEPEQIALSADGTTAFVTLQENNAIARVDLATATVTALLPLGVKDHSADGNGLDASDSDGRISIEPLPFRGLYTPDGLASFDRDGETWVVTANEGDGRNYRGFAEVVRLTDVVLDPAAYPEAAAMQDLGSYGRLKISRAEGDVDGDGDIDLVHVFGGRSISVWDSDGNQVWDSGDLMEQTIASVVPDQFNCDAFANGTFDDRSDDGGPEPEGIVIGEVGGAPYAFVGLERVGGVFVFDLSEPTEPTFVQYINSRDFSGSAEAGTAGDLSPEGLIFIPAEDSPNDTPLLVVAHEVSGTTVIYQIL